MLCNMKTAAFNEVDCFQSTTPEEGKTYCSCCENEQPSKVTSWVKQVMNPYKQTERVTVYLLTCKRCTDMFNQYGAD